MSSSKPSAMVQLVDGTMCDPFNPDWSTISLEVVAHSLSKMDRYNSHTKGFYSVLAHSIDMSKIIIPLFRLEHLDPIEKVILQLQCLLHDCPEVLIGDVSWPIKQAYPEFGAADVAASRSCFEFYELGPMSPYVSILDRYVAVLENGTAVKRNSWADKLESLESGLARYNLPYNPHLESAQQFIVWIEERSSTAMNSVLREYLESIRDEWLDSVLSLLARLFVLKSRRTSRRNDATFDRRLAETNALVGLFGELGEFVDLCKKIHYHNKQAPLERLEEEFGDVCWYASETINLKYDDVSTIPYKNEVVSVFESQFSTYRYALNWVGITQEAVIDGLNECVMPQLARIDFHRALRNNVKKLELRYPDGFKPQPG